MRYFQFTVTILMSLAVVNLSGCGGDSGSGGGAPYQKSPIVHLVFSVNNTSAAPVTFAMGCPNELCKLNQWGFSSFNEDGCDDAESSKDNVYNYTVEPGSKCDVSFTTADFSSYPVAGTYAMKLFAQDSGNYSCSTIQAISAKLIDGQTTNVIFPDMTCTSTTKTLKIQAENTKDATQVALTSPQLGVIAADKNSIKPITLTAQNNFGRTVKLNNQDYQVSISPSVNSLDRVASYPQTISQKDRALSIDYKLTDAKLVGHLAITHLNAKTITQLPYNILELSGLFKNGQVVSAAQSRLINTPIPRYVTPLICVNQTPLGQIETVVASLPANIKGIAIQVKTINSDFVQKIKEIRSADPDLMIVFDVENRLSSTDVKNLSALIQHKDSVFPGWIQTTPQSIPALAGTIDSNYLVIDTQKLKMPALESLLKHYSTLPVNGLVISTQQLDGIQQTDFNDMPRHDLDLTQTVVAPNHQKIRDLVFLAHSSRGH